MGQPDSAVTPEILVRKLWAFFKSVWPEDRAHVALLLGATLLMIVPATTDWGLWQEAIWRTVEPRAANFVVLQLQIPFLLAYFAGAACLYISFFPGAAPRRSLVRWVYLPCAAGWIALAALSQYLASDYHVAEIETAGGVFSGKGFVAFLQMCKAPAILSGVAIALITYAHARFRDGVVELPVRVGGEDRSTDEDEKGAERRFVWTVVALTPLVVASVGSMLMFAIARLASVLTHEPFPSATAVAPSINIANAIASMLVVAWGIGSGFAKTIRASLRLPAIRYVFAGVAIPFVAAGAMSVCRYTVARIQWAHGASSWDGAPQLLHFLPTIAWVSLWALLPALVEEIAWRGYLQPRFISRYGIYRGIFLVGVIWGAYHFPLNFGRHMGPVIFVMSFAARIVNCVACGFAFSWLALKARSVIPAAIAHGLMNALYDSNPVGRWDQWGAYVIWALLSFALYRYWPPNVEADLELLAPQDDQLTSGGGVVGSPA